VTTTAAPTRASRLSRLVPVPAGAGLARMMVERNITSFRHGWIASVMKSKSTHDRMNVVANMPTAANANPMNTAAGTASSAHHDCTAPAATATSRNAVE
jgi:hypothetical protein